MSKEFKYGDIHYHDLQLVNRNSMQGYGIATDARVAMAEKVQLLPIVASEFRHVCPLMPIVFSPVGKPMPIAVTSLTPQKNNFVNNGQWRENTYVPLSIRRYPFTLADITQQGHRTLCIDQAALAENSPNPLFSENAENNEEINNAIELCKQFEASVINTEKAIDAIEEEGLFADKQLEITQANGNKLTTGALKVIDLAKYTALTDEQIIKLHKAQALWLIHTHIISMDRLVDIANADSNIESNVENNTAS